MITETLHPQYLKNFDGSNSFMVLPINEYEELIEDYNDLMIIAKRRNDKKISLEELKNRLNCDESIYSKTSII